MLKIKWILVFLLLVVLIYTRFINLYWGLPNPMHPDERNMANAIQNLNCEIRNSKFEIRDCLNPHFFAYGQFPLYLGYVGVLFLKFFDGDLGTPVSFGEAALSLRIISAVASILNVFVLIKMVDLLISKSQFLISKQFSIFNFQFSIFLLLTFSPFFIQFSHFGTTESLLMLLYSLIIYLSIKFSQNKLRPSSFYLLSSIFSGLAIATKVSSVLFLVVPIALMFDQVRNTILHRSISIWYLLTLTLVFSILFSPHNFISFPEFLGSMKYESDVAFGDYRAFYTRQFEGTPPFLFQFGKIFPYVLGWPALIFFLLGFLLLPFKLEFNLLRLGILAGFLPNAFFYAKWTRFMTPILPMMLVFAVLFLVSMYRYILSKISNIKNQISTHSTSSGLILSKVEGSKLHIKYQKFCILICYFALCILIFAFIMPGISYLSIYQNPDVRFTASDWIYNNIPDKSYLLFETANVVDIPITNPKSEIRNPKQTQNSNYQMISFNFYDLDQNPILKLQLQEHLVKADYIFIPSRRIFANHYCPLSLSFRGIPSTRETEKSSEAFFTIRRNVGSRFLSIARNDTEENQCKYLRKRYPLLNDYYDKLFSGELGFEKVAEFSSFPRIQLFGRTILEFPDENAEETWTVFDHPVIRIYKKI